MATHVALLRGINLGRSRRIAMADLRAVLTAAGHTGVRTHLQSGNVLLTSDEPAERLERLIEAQIRDGLGMEVPVVVRTRDELADVVARNPLSDVADDDRRLQVTFLAAELPPAAADELAAIDFAPERLAISGRELYAWHPEGIQSSALAAELSGSRFPVVGTARNWRTVTKLLELADT